MAVTMDWLSREKMTTAWRWGIPLVAAIVVVDQLTKAWVLATPEFRAIDCLTGAAPCGRTWIAARRLDRLEVHAQGPARRGRQWPLRGAAPHGDVLWERRHAGGAARSEGAKAWRREALTVLAMRWTV